MSRIEVPNHAIRYAGQEPGPVATDPVRETPIPNRSFEAHQNSRRSLRRGAVLVAAMAVLAGRVARAQTAGSGFAVDRFEPAGGGSEWFSLESLDFRGRVRPALGLVIDGAWKPLVVFDQNGNPVATMLRDQLVATPTPRWC